MRCPFCGDTHAAGTYVCPKTQRRLAGVLAPGTVVDGKYKIVDVIGTGGMAVVYRAENVKIGRHVALKMLLPEYVQYPELCERVEREARAAGGIDHPNVVAIVDLGSAREFGPYIAMELLKGEELATYLERRGGRLPSPEAVEITRQVLAALDAAHARNVVHRDLKPENVFLARIDDDRLTVKVLDFGISKLGGAGGPTGPGGGPISSLTRTGTVMGTPQFMAPEQAAGLREQDARVDIYACGAVLYAMLANALPYEAENYNLLINEILNKPPRPITDRVPGIDARLAAIVMRAIARKPEQRYPTARAMQDALVNWLNTEADEFDEPTTGLSRLRAGRAPTQPPGVIPQGGDRATGRRPAIRVSTAPPGIPPRGAARPTGAGAPPPPPPARRPTGGTAGPDDPTAFIGAPRPDPHLAHDDATTATAAPPAEDSDFVIPVETMSPAAAAAAAHAPAPAASSSDDAYSPTVAAVVPPPRPNPNRANTRTPLGWENTPAAVILPRPQRSRAWVVALAALAVLGGGAFAVRQLSPSLWNRAVKTVRLNDLAVADPAAPADAGVTGRPASSRGASGSGHSSGGAGGGATSGSSGSSGSTTNTGNTAPGTAGSGDPTPGSSTSGATRSGHTGRTHRNTRRTPPRRTTTQQRGTTSTTTRRR